MLSYIKFGPVVQEEISFKDISYLELWQPLCSVDWKCHLNVFLIWSSGSPFVWRSVTICATLVEGIKSYNSVKLF